MLHSLRLVVLSLALGALAVLVGAPAAQADPWADCGPHALEEQVVRVFPRAAISPGPAGTSSALQCGNRWYGLRHMQPEWAGTPGDWRAAADAAIARTLAAGAPATYDPRGDTWTVRSSDTVVVLGARGLVIDAHPAAG